MNKCVETLKGKIKNPIFIACLAGMALMILGVFLPLYKISLFGISKSMNYFYVEGELADGIYILILAIGMLVLHAFNKPKFACIPAILSLALLIHCYLDIKDSLSSVGMNLGSFGIGFYLMILGTIVAGVTSFLLKDKE